MSEELLARIQQLEDTVERLYEASGLKEKDEFRELRARLEEFYVSEGFSGREARRLANADVKHGRSLGEVQYRLENIRDRERAQKEHEAAEAVRLEGLKKVDESNRRIRKYVDMMARLRLLGPHKNAYPLGENSKATYERSLANADEAELEAAKIICHNRYYK